MKKGLLKLYQKIHYDFLWLICKKCPISLLDFLVLSGLAAGYFRQIIHPFFLFYIFIFYAIFSRLIDDYLLGKEKEKDK